MTAMVVAQPVFLWAGVDVGLGMIPLNDGKVLFVDDQSRFRTVSCSPEFVVEEWTPSWDPATDGWAGSGRICSLSGSSDGGLVCFTMAVDPGNGTGWPLAVIVCESDGSDARPLALSYEVGGGPQFDFTLDSESIYGSPIVGCRSETCCYQDREDYLAGFDSGLDPLHVDMIEIDTGRATHHDVCQDYGYNDCPWSDLVGNGGDSAFRVYDVVRCASLFELEERSAYSVIDTWVLPDAGLAFTENGQILRFADGREIANPGDMLVAYARLDDGRYLYSFDHGTTVMLGNMDWERFRGMDPVLQPELSGVLPWESWYGDVVVQGETLYFAGGDSLFRCTLIMDSDP